MNKNLLFILFLGFALAGCEKDAGEGGLASIEGKLYVHKYNGNCAELRDEYYAVDERVYIIAGDEPSHFDNVRTGPDGTFWFRYLRKGKYKIYAVSKDCVNIGRDTIASMNVEITDRKQKVVTEDLVIIQ